MINHLVVEVCHDLINRALRCEGDPMSDLATANDCRAKERAIRDVMDAATLTPERIARWIDSSADTLTAKAEPSDFERAIAAILRDVASALRAGAWKATQ